MSITVAVNAAADSANGPQTVVCETAAQHDDCGSGGGGGELNGGGVDEDDMAVFDREKSEKVKTTGGAFCSFFVCFFSPYTKKTVPGDRCRALG